MATVLIVDDSQTALLGMREMLERNNYEAVTAQDGLSAFAAMQTLTPDLIILDIGLPYINGIDLCAAIRRTRILSSIPIIVVTGSHKHIDAKRAQEHGAFAYFTKPVDESDLLAAISTCLTPAAA